METEIEERISDASKVYYSLNGSVIRKKEISRRTKLIVYKTIFRPTLIYGSESWVLNKSQKSKLQAVNMKYLRANKGVTRMDRIRSNIIRTRGGTNT